MSEGVLSRPVAVADIHRRSDVDVTAGPQERAALAAEYDLLDVLSLQATATLSSVDGGVDVSGRVTADIVQSCVVTLVPVEQHIDEPFSVRFVRAGSPELEVVMKPHADVMVDPAAPDPPEVLEGPTVDLGAVVEEAFVLAIDPYPRARGAALPEEATDGQVKDSPFAVLADLKQRKRS